MMEMTVVSLQIAYRDKMKIINIFRDKGIKRHSNSIFPQISEFLNIVYAVSFTTRKANRLGEPHKKWNVSGGFTHCKSGIG